MKRRHLAIAPLLTVAAAAAQQPAPRVVPDELSCPRCTITVRPIVTLGADDGPGSLKGRPRSVNIDARGRYWVFEELDVPLVFGVSGDFLQKVGRLGAGPGEFRSANFGLVVGDSMLVFDWLGSRATMVDSYLRPGRAIGYRPNLGPAVMINWPHLVIMHGHAPASSPPNSVLHRVSFSEREMSILGSFGPQGAGGPMGIARVQQILAPGGQSHFWSADWSRYRFVRWSPEGRSDAAFERKPRWFDGSVAAGLTSLDGPPGPSMKAIHEDRNGLVWTFTSVPAPTWRDALPKMAPGQREVRSRDIDWGRLYRTMIEVIDPATARVLARQRLDRYLHSVLPGDRATLYFLDANDIPRLEIVSLVLRGR